MNAWSASSDGPSGLPEVQLKAVDVLIVVGCSCAALLLVGPFRWAPGSMTSALHYTVFALGPLVLRTLESYFPRQRLLAFMANFWLLPVVALGHSMLNPLVTAVTPVLRDAQLAAMDQRLFGVQASVMLERLLPCWLTEVLLLCYYGYFLWPLLMGMVLYFTGRREAFDEYLLALGLFFTCNFVFYALMPAIGPRYFLFGSFTDCLQGLWLTPYLESAMRMPGFAKDCFPSGHTGVTLLVLSYAWRFERRFFRVMLLPGLGLILATLAGRFHYATDLLCATPLVLATVGLAMALTRAVAARREAEARGVRINAVARS